MPSRNTYRLTWVSLTFDEGYLLTAAPPDLERGVAPLGPPAPTQPPLLRTCITNSHCMAETHIQGAAAAQLQEGREELLHVQGQEGRPCGDTPHPR